MKVVVTTDERMGLPSASAMPLLFACDGAWRAQLDADEQAIRVDDDTRDSLKGTELHKANESGDVSDLDEADADLIERVRATEEALVSDWAASTGHTLKDVEIVREQRFWVEDLFSAQIDLLAINYPALSLFVLDLKSGRKKVAPPVRNHQLRACAVAAYRHYWVQTIGLPKRYYAPVRTAIVQPMVESQAACDYSAQNLDVCLDKIRLRLDYVKQPNLPRTPGSWCEFCRARAVCPEARKAMSLTIRSGLTLNWDLETPDTKLALFKAACLAEDCAGAIKAHVRKELEVDPQSIPGLAVAKDQHPRKIIDLIGIYKARAAEVSSHPDEATEAELLYQFLEHSKMSVSELEKLLQRTKGLSKDAAKKWISQFPQFVETGLRRGRIDLKEEE